MNLKLRYGSVCSGIEAATVAWHHMGWHASWLAEIEKFPSAVLAYHYPQVPNLGDMTKIKDKVLNREVDAPDILTGGTPCQAFSVAGLRKGLDDDRGQLSLEFCRLANAIDEVRATDGDRPSIIIWENVPGVLSSKDNAFGCFLASLAGDDEPARPSSPPIPGRSNKHWRWCKKTSNHLPKWPTAGCVYGPQRAVAWRVLDAQYFGVPQRRRRVWVVASSRDGFDPARILFEFQSMRRDSAPSREQRQEVAGCSGECATFRNKSFGEYISSSSATLKASGTDLGPGCEALSVALRGREGGSTAELGDEVSGCLRASSGGGGGDKPHVLLFGGNNQSGPIDQAAALNANRGCHNPGDFEAGNLVVSGPLCANGKAAGSATQQDAEQGMLVVTQYGEDQAGTLTVRHDSSPCADRGMNVLAFPTQMSGTQVASSEDISPALSVTHTTSVAFSCKNDGGDATDELSPTLRAMNHDGSHCNAGGQLAVAWAQNSRDEIRLENGDGSIVGSLSGQGGKPGQGYPTIANSDQRVRRLTPKECERLQGFPDGYTDIPWKLYQECQRKGLSFEHELIKRGQTLKNSVDKCPDGPRYKALGNSWAVPCAWWIGQRITQWFMEEIKAGAT